MRHTTNQLLVSRHKRFYKELCEKESKFVSMTTKFVSPSPRHARKRKENICVENSMKTGTTSLLRFKIMTRKSEASQTHFEELNQMKSC